MQHRTRACFKLSTRSHGGLRRSPGLASAPPKCRHFRAKLCQDAHWPPRCRSTAVPSPSSERIQKKSNDTLPVTFPKHTDSPGREVRTPRPGGQGHMGVCAHSWSGRPPSPWRVAEQKGPLSSGHLAQSVSTPPQPGCSETSTCTPKPGPEARDQGSEPTRRQAGRWAPTPPSRPR